jgi:hypothetical protein
MAATYPGAIKQFVSHKNNIEDIDASHVNSLQDEVSSIQTVIGTFPQIDPTLNYQFNDYGTIRNRFEQISRGTHIPIFGINRTVTRQVIPNNTLVPITWDTSTQLDPFNMFSSGTDIVLSRTGWWTFSGFVTWTSITTETNLRFMTLNWANRFGSDPNQLSSWFWTSTVASANPILSTSYLGFGYTQRTTTVSKYNKGAIIRVYAQHQHGSNLDCIAGLSGTFIRDI